MFFGYLCLRAARDSLILLKQRYPKNIWDLVIPVDTKIRDASHQGIPASLIDPDSKSVVAYTALLDMLLQDEVEVDKDLAVT
jgi:chromosome partitioning protein